MTSEPTIDYEGLAQEAMRGVVRTVLAQTAKSGLTGDHHFYISFDTEAAGVSISKRLKEKYPREMTIVLQHRFWDLAVTDERFEVKLTFDGIPERLVVPFAAIKVFFDPSVRYGLQFEDPNIGPDSSAHAQASNALDGANRSGIARATQTRKASRPPRRPRAEPAREETQQQPPPDAGNDASRQAPPVTAAPVGINGRSGAKPAVEKAESPKPESGGAEIVSLDKFRKK